MKLNCKSTSTAIYCPDFSGNLTGLPNITLHFSNKVFELQPGAYADSHEDKSEIMFEPSPTDEWILGQPFFRDNLVVFDHGRLYLAEAL